MKLFWVGQEPELQELDEPMEMLEELPEETGQLALDIIENNHSIIIFSPIAGIDLSNIDVSYKKWVLKIEGKRKQPEMFFDEDIVIKNSECYWGKFSRNIILPDNLDADSISATMENNLLMISINKMKYDDQDSIKINRM